MAPKPRTAAQIERETNRRLIRTYGITLADYDSMLASQGGGCAICGRPEINSRLHVDHCHKFQKLFRVKAKKQKSEPWWFAHTVHKSDAVAHFYLESYGETKKQAVDTVKRLLRAESVRGVICWPCNRGLRVFYDNAKSLERAGQYLRRFQER